MTHPLAAISVGQRRRAFVPFLAFTLLVMAVLAGIDRRITTTAVPRGIVSFEVAGDPATAQRMMDSWDARARLHVAFSNGIDYLFMVLYSTTIALACLWAASVYARYSSVLAAAGVWLAWGQWLAALLDATENVALTVMIFGGVRAPWPALAWWCAVPKFALIVAGLLYALGALLQRAVRPAGSRATAAPVLPSARAARDTRRYGAST